MARLPKFMSYLFAFLLSFALAATAQANSNDVVLYASKAPVRAGTWAVQADSTAAAGYLIQNPDLGAAKLLVPLAKPLNYFEISFPAYAGLPYHLWIRSKSLNNSASNDSHGGLLVTEVFRQRDPGRFDHRSHWNHLRGGGSPASVHGSSGVGMGLV